MERCSIIAFINYCCYIIFSILSKNNIACDCDARWLLEWITDNRFTSPLCARPPFLSGQEITKFILPDICGEYKHAYIHVRFVQGEIERERGDQGFA